MVGGFAKQTLKKQWLIEVCILDNDFKRSFTVLLEHHIGEAHVGPVIECALELVGKKIEFQKYPTVNQMNKEHLTLSQIQLVKTLPHSSTLTLLSDETFKCLDGYRVCGE